MTRREILPKPPLGMIDHRFQRPGLGKEVARVRNDLQRLGPSQSGHRVLIEVNNAEIVAAYDQKGWRTNLIECLAGKIGAPAPRDHRADAARKPRRCNKRGRRSGAGAEEPKRELCDRRLTVEPKDDINKPAGQQANIEHVDTIDFLCRR